MSFPYVSHGIISEKEIINKVLKKHLFNKTEKFIQEVLWRIYWRGWLELRPMVWNDYLIKLKVLNEEYKTNKNYLNAIKGETNIQCFNDWVNELKETNYLHNHHECGLLVFGYLKLPWELERIFKTFI